MLCKEDGKEIVGGNHFFLPLLPKTRLEVSKMFRSASWSFLYSGQSFSSRCRLNPLAAQEHERLAPANHPRVVASTNRHATTSLKFQRK
jgi:hypothetical protein